MGYCGGRAAPGRLPRHRGLRALPCFALRFVAQMLGIFPRTAAKPHQSIRTIAFISVDIRYAVVKESVQTKYLCY